MINKSLEKEFEKILCKRIIELRKNKGLTMEKLAYESGISKGGLSEIERCIKSPRPFTIIKICAALNISLKEFYDYKEFDDFIEIL